MKPVAHPLLVRVRGLRGFLAASLRELLRVEAHDGAFVSQRICPSCLSETSCMACAERGQGSSESKR
jgi:hypothetical protein